MDLEAATDQNARADRLTRVGMAICFLVTGAILLAALTVAKSIERQAEVPQIGSSLRN
jgi:hypothetical protein